MITIFKQKNDIPEDLEYIELNDVFFNQHTASLLDENAVSLIQKIDHSEMISKYRMKSRFSDIALDIDCLSTGCKTILNVFYFPDRVFGLKECGNNALNIFYQLEKGYVYSEYALIPLEMNCVMVQDHMGKRMISDYEELKEWWQNEK